MFYLKLYCSLLYIRNLYTLILYLDLTRIFPLWLLLRYFDVFYAGSTFLGVGLVTLSPLLFLLLQCLDVAKFCRKYCIKYCFKFILFPILPSYINYIFWRCPQLLNVLLPYFSFAFSVQKFFHVLKLRDYFLSPAHYR